MSRFEQRGIYAAKVLKSSKLGRHFLGAQKAEVPTSLFLLAAPGRYKASFDNQLFTEQTLTCIAGAYKIVYMQDLWRVKNRSAG